ncbi:MAG: hypothetical protein HEP71_04245 [Roseivirga sp.]|nr:hypothetical protein [Roseivirga sp.]
MYIFLAANTGLMGQEAKIRSVQSIYNRSDQAKVKLQIESDRATMFIDLSHLGITGKPDKEAFLDLVSEGKIDALQPGSFRREESATKIFLKAKKQLPDEFEIGGVTYYRTIVDLGTINGKELATEVYLMASDTEQLNPSLNLNFNWNSLKMNKTCAKPVCQEWVLKDGKAFCKRMKCG